MEYYLYKHTRLDTNIIFYIGISKKLKGNTSRQKYRRAYSKSRNFIWRNIVNKTPYRIDIIEERETLKEILELETILIKQYGRIVNKTGTLANLIEESSQIPKKLREVSKEKAKLLKKKTYKYTLLGDYIEEFESLTEAAKSVNLSPTDLSNSMNKRNFSSGGYIWSYKKQDKIDSLFKSKELNKRESRKTGVIRQYDIFGNHIKDWWSLKELVITLKIKSSKFRNVLSGISSSSNGYLWCYAGEEDKILNNIKKYRLIVFDKDLNKIGEYLNIREAEVNLNLSLNTISVYFQRQEKHPKYIFYDNKRKSYNENSFKKLKNE